MNFMNEDQTKDRIIEANAREYGPLFNYIPWIDEDGARLATLERIRLLQTPGINVSCLGTKIHHGALSPGCQQCAGRAWSCLFISGRCNGRCFYCPTPQNVDDPPMSGSVPFHRAKDYADYVRFFRFGGASISGGEPFLDFDTSLAYVRALRQTCGPELHIWLYTNGILATEDKLRRLAAAGLNEIRFDIGATDYSLEHARLARGIVPTVTVEIPAVPEETERLRALLPELSAAGVSHLNLHQLRLTPHNARHLLERDYTYVHGPKVTVLESELCALELVAHGARHDLPLAINYCSFVYKHRFQGAASRERFGAKLLEEGEELTASGHIRTLRTQAAGDGDWQTAPMIDVGEIPPDRQLKVTYAAAFVRAQNNPNFSSCTVSISEDFQVVLERHPVHADRLIDPQGFGQDLQAPQPDSVLPDYYSPRVENSYEWITPGLGMYF